MFVFSGMHAWQGEETVQQVLVFSSSSMKELFDHEMDNRLQKALLAEGRFIDANSKRGISIKDGLSDSNAGAIYKLRAVKNSQDQYIPVIRCGITGEGIWEGHMTCSSPEQTLAICGEYLKEQIVLNLKELNIDLNKNHS